jgi:hypothetical protein
MILFKLVPIHIGVTNMSKENLRTNCNCATMRTGNDD